MSRRGVMSCGKRLEISPRLHHGRCFCARSPNERAALGSTGVPAFAHGTQDDLRWVAVSDANCCARASGRERKTAEWIRRSHDDKVAIGSEHGEFLLVVHWREQFGIRKERRDQPLEAGRTSDRYQPHASIHADEAVQYVLDRLLSRGKKAQQPVAA